MVGTKTGPFTAGPIIAAPIAPTAAGRNEASISFVNTPGLINFPTFMILQFFLQRVRINPLSV